MSIQLNTFITNVLAMRHYSNDSAGSGVKHDSHEDALAVELQKVGYTEILQQGTRQTKPSKKNPNGHIVKTKTFPKLGRDAVKKAIRSDNTQQELAKLVPGMSPGTFIRQPCGPKAFPDFLLCDFSGTIVLIEAKSGGGNVPVWNGGLPQKDSIYILSSGIYNSSTVFLGHDVMKWELSKLLQDHHDALQIQSKALKHKASQLDTFNRGFYHYTRSKFEQQGGLDKTDYFKHADRTKCEQNVLAFALAQ